MEINIVSFNIRSQNDENGHSIDERAPRLRDVVCPLNPDVFCIQEYKPQWEKHIENYFGKEYEIFNKYRNLTVDIESSPILWKKDKFKCEKTGYFWLSDTPEVESRGWDEVYNCYRMCVYVVLKDIKTGKSFTVMNTHFGFGDKGQVASAKLICEYYKKISDFPTFITGDFNMNPNTPGYAEMVKNFTDVNSVSAKETRNTYHGYNPEKYPEYHIDYCFVDDKITPLSYKFIDTLIDGKYPSDHYGLSLKLEV